MAQATQPAAWTCATCGKVHDGLATVFGADEPQPWSEATDAERAAGLLSADECLLPLADATYYFLRGQIELAITDAAPGYESGPFCWSVWVSLSEANVDLAHARWDDPDRASLEPMFGWLSSELPYPASTLNLPTHVHTRPPGVVPLIELDPSLDHPLVREQLNGITMHRLQEINEQLMG